MEVIRCFKQNGFKVEVRVINQVFVGTLFDGLTELPVKATSKSSHFDCMLKGFAYLRANNDMPSNYNFKTEYLPDTNALCLQ